MIASALFLTNCSLKSEIHRVNTAIVIMLLAINGLGLGGCWIGIHPRKQRIEGMRAHFKLPDSIIPIAGIALGRPRAKPEKRTRFNSDYVLVYR